MAEEVAANQPEAGAQTTAANPRVGADGNAPTTEQQAIAAIATRLEPETGPTNNVVQESQNDSASEVAESDQPVTETDDQEVSEQETSSEGDATSEPTDIGEELPDTLNGLAEAIGMDEAELAKHLKMPIKVNGETQMVSLADAASGQQLDADYRQKTATLAEERREFESQKQQASQHLQQRLQAADARLATLNSEMQTQFPAEKLTQLAAEDPAEYVRVKAQLDARQAALIGQHQAQEAERQRLTQEHEAGIGAFRHEQQQLFIERYPEYLDAKKLETFESGMVDTLSKKGFSEDDINGFIEGAWDVRVVDLIRDAVQWNNMQSQKKTITKKLKGLPRVQRPGTSVTGRRAQAGDGLAEAKNRINRTGATDSDAVDYVRRLLE